MGKGSVGDLIARYLNPNLDSDQEPTTSLISIRVSTDIKDRLHCLAAVLETKPSPLAAELFTIALEDAIEALPEEAEREFMEHLMQLEEEEKYRQR